MKLSNSSFDKTKNIGDKEKVENGQTISKVKVKYMTSNEKIENMRQKMSKLNVKYMT